MIDDTAKVVPKINSSTQQGTPLFLGSSGTSAAAGNIVTTIESIATKDRT